MTVEVDAALLHDFDEEDVNAVTEIPVWADNSRVMLTITKGAKEIKVGDDPSKTTFGDFKLSLQMQVRDPDTSEIIYGGGGTIFYNMGLPIRNLEEANGGNPQHKYSSWSKQKFDALIYGAKGSEGYKRPPYATPEEAKEQSLKYLGLAKETLITKGDNLLEDTFYATLRQNPFNGRMGYELKQINESPGELTPRDKLIEMWNPLTEEDK